MRILPTFRSLAAVVLALVLFLSSDPVLSQGGRMAIMVPEPTDAGDWNGTWFYNTAAMKMALWMRTQKGKTEVKLKYDSGERPLTFETDWNGDATFYSNEQPSTFQMRLTKTGPNRMEGTWFWELPLGATVRTEKATLSIFRTHDGRVLVFKFDDYDLTTMHSGRPFRSSTAPLWTFMKASKRLTLWDEILF